MPETTVFGTLSGDLTEQARRALDLARDEARGLGYQFVSTEHLLLGVLGEGTSEAAALLAELGLDSVSVRRATERLIGRGSGVVGPQMPFTPRARYAWEIGFVESEERRSPYMGVEHILFGVVREGLMAGSRGGGASSVLRSFRLDLRDLEKRVVALFTAPAPTEAGLAVAELPPSPVVAATVAPPQPAAVAAAPVAVLAEVPVPPAPLPCPSGLVAAVVRARCAAALIARLGERGLVACGATVGVADGDSLTLDVVYFAGARLVDPAAGTPLPDLAVLVTEPGADAARTMLLTAKLQICLALGSRAALLVDPADRTVRLMAADGPPRSFAHPDLLPLDALQSGLAVPLAEIFGCAPVQ